LAVALTALQNPAFPPVPVRKLKNINKATMPPPCVASGSFSLEEKILHMPTYPTRRQVKA
jgi:hypothetical protein